MTQFLRPDGTAIPFVPGFYDRHKKRDAESFLAEGSSRPENRAPLSYKAFLKDAFLYSLMVDLFQKTGITIRAKRALDVGGGEGTMARLMKSDQRSEQVHVIELYDMQSLLPDTLYAQHLRKHRLTSALYRLGISQRAWRPSLFEAFDYFPNPSDAYFNIGGRRGDIDSYTLRDFYSTDGSYDLLTAFSCVDYFDPNKFLEKASTLVSPGGHLYLHLAYWWFPVNCSMAVGDFPFAAQRLTSSEYEAYLRTHHPQDAANMMRLYNYFHLGKDHPVADDYVEMANRAGFELLAMRKLMTRSSGAAKMTSSTAETLSDDAHHSPARVLAEIQRFAPGVRLSDLKTFNLLLGFKRR